MLAKLFFKKNFLSILKPSLYSLAGSFFVAAGWSWYHEYKHPFWLFIIKAIAVWLVALAGYQAVKGLFLYGVKRYRRHAFWHTDFLPFLDKLFFFFSLLFLVFFIRNAIVGLVYTALVFILLFNRLQQYIAHHPDPLHWLRVNRTLGIFAFSLFLLQATLQYVAYHYYILDANARFFDIVFFRSVIMTLFWLGTFMAGSLWFAKFKGSMRYLLLGLWLLFFLGVVAVWVVNVGVLYYSGLYFSPIALEHAEGGGDVITHGINLYLIAGGIAIAVLMVLVLIRTVKAFRLVPRRYWNYYHTLVITLALFACFSFASFRNTPEVAMAKSFYAYYFGHEKPVTLDPVVVKKLQRFGLYFNPGVFYVGDHPTVFSPSSTTKLLPNRFAHQKPNILIVYLESFSARFTDIYNPALKGVTPNFDAFAADSHTTIFRNYYNASTPTITGTLSQLCSFLPPTGHEEIDTQGKFQSLRLLCLPEVLKKYAGFKYAAYVTAVDKEFAHKDTIFGSMGIDKIYGTSELKPYINGEPLAWGYSDHQLFPAVWSFMQQAPQPFLMMLATVDTHAPFDLPKDMVPYGDGSSKVLNTFHTTDDAFGKFWNQFKQSPYYNNTIVIAVADHAIFPGALTESFAAWPNHADTQSMHTFYDENTFLMYIPDSVLPKTVDTYASGIDELPTIAQIFNINIPNSFEGHSIFDDRSTYPNLLGMHEFGLYINEQTPLGGRKILYDLPSDIECPPKYTASSTPELTLCDYKNFYDWKRQMFEEGRFWKHE